MPPVPEVAALTLYATPPLPATVNLRLDVTERPLPLALGEATLYPKPAELEAALFEQYSLALGRVLVTAGADEAIDRVCRAYLSPGRTAVVTTPTFEMIPHYARLAGARIEEVAWYDGELTAASMLERGGVSDCVRFVVSPNNPTGVVARTEELLTMARSAPESLLLVDLAYGEFADADPTHALMEQPNVVVTRTFSKAWGIPGARVGYALAAPEIIAAMRLAGGPYSVARPSLALALERLRTGQTEMRDYVRMARDEAQRLRTVLLGHGLDVPDSQANFVMMRGSRVPAIADALARRGIGTRAFRDPALADARRMVVPVHAETFERVLRAVDDAVAETR